MTHLRIFICFFCFSCLCLEGAETGNDIRSKKAALKDTSRITPQPFIDVVEGQLKALREKDIDKAYNDFSSKEFRKKITLEDFRKIVNQSKPLANNKLFQFQSFFVEEEIASLGGEIHSENGETIPVEYDFISEDGKWKILGIQIFQNEILSSPHQKD